MSYELELREFIKKFMLEQNNPDAEKISNELPWHRVVNLYWCASAHYRIGNAYMSLNEITNPEHSKVYCIWSPGKMTNYQYWNGKFSHVGEAHEEDYKG